MSLWRVFLQGSEAATGGTLEKGVLENFAMPKDNHLCAGVSF